MGTPMIQQYLQIKQNYKEAILFFRLGDFYEMFFDDALVASKALEITLTSRDGGAAGRVPMCGVPYHAAGTYLARLVENGHRVAICEQIDEPDSTRGIVRREVVRVVSPGTIFDDHLLDEKKHNFLASLSSEGQAYGLAFVDITTGLCRLTQFDGEGALTCLLDELSRLEPAEILVCNQEYNQSLTPVLSQRTNALITMTEGEYFERRRAIGLMEKQFGRYGVEQDLWALTLGVRAMGGLLGYLHVTQQSSLAQITRVDIYSCGQYMMMDGITRRNLEIVKSLKDGNRSDTLFAVLDHTATAMGSRLLKNWLEQPLIDLERIQDRLDSVAELVGDMQIRLELRDYLKSVYDFERLAGRIGFGTASARDLAALRQSLQVLPKIITALQRINSRLGISLREKIDPLQEIRQLLENAIVDDPPPSLRDGGMIREGYQAKVDQLRTAAMDGKSWLARLESEQREKTGIKSLKVAYNKVFGYYIEVTKSNLHLVPEHYVRRQTLANAERYITPQLKEYEEVILGAVDRLAQLEYQLFIQVRDQVAEYIKELQSTARAVAGIDVLVALAEAAVKGHYVRPQITDRQVMEIRDGRHPVVEVAMGKGKFVPNDASVDENSFLVMLTGPNMAGKSTYMRQLALIVLMAQVGSFVPATRAMIGIVDRIFTRVGAADNLAGGQSTFMVEMNECRMIVEGATNRSLIIMDEVGRGTSTYDGISIARAVVEYIHARIGARTFFSTHYHELTDLDQLIGIVNYTVRVQEAGEDIVFLHRVVPGKADRSYGIHVARLAGLPAEVVQRAQEILLDLQGSRGNVELDVLAPTPRGEVGAPEKKEDNGALWLELAQLDISSLTPLQALNMVARWQARLVGTGNGGTGERVRG